MHLSVKIFYSTALKLLFHNTTHILCKVTPTTGHLHSTCFTFRFDGYNMILILDMQNAICVVVLLYTKSKYDFCIQKHNKQYLNSQHVNVVKDNVPKLQVGILIVLCNTPTMSRGNCFAPTLLILIAKCNYTCGPLKVGFNCVKIENPI